MQATALGSGTEAAPIEWVPGEVLALVFCFVDAKTLMVTIPSVRTIVERGGAEVGWWCGGVVVSWRHYSGGKVGGNHKGTQDGRASRHDGHMHTAQCDGLVSSSTEHRYGCFVARRVHGDASIGRCARRGVRSAWDRCHRSSSTSTGQLPGQHMT